MMVQLTAIKACFLQKYRKYRSMHKFQPKHQILQGDHSEEK